MVAEKPALSSSIAKILSHGSNRSRKSSCRACPVHEYEGTFRQEQVLFKMTSVCGHVHSLDFNQRYNNWDKVDPDELFSAPTEKKEATPELHMAKFLQIEGRGVDYVVLWLDCDREGENICFEVLEHVKPVMKGSGGGRQTVFRAKFSAITETEIVRAMKTLGEPNRNEALAVDARQELDLRIGCAFTRYQTKFFQGKYGDLDSTLISFGPCQTPTLAFCVERHDVIQSFKPEPFWSVDLRVEHSGHSLAAHWDRGRVFDKEIGQMFVAMCKDEKSVCVTSVTQKEKSKQRPIALNTVELLRVASAALGIGPATTMQVAERLYTQGYISYPRTETTSYPSSFDINGALRPLTSLGSVGHCVRDLLSSGPKKPRPGHDAGDHPPITPMRAAHEADLSGDAWRVYDYIVRHFVATVSEDCRYHQTTIQLSVGTERFSLSGKRVLSPGFTTLLSGLAIQNDESLPNVKNGDEMKVASVRLTDGHTSPPDYLTESELITLMEQHGIGTDASIPVHINTISQRNYVSVTGGRRLQPTPLGIVLVHGYQKIDADLVLPTMRSAVEKQLDLIAQGKADYDAVLQHALDTFHSKFRYFVEQVTRMDELFEVSFSKLAETGRPMSRCGKCRRYMKYISAKPQRLYCPQCEETYSLPPNGNIKLNKEIKCPLDDFELVLWSAGGRGKTYSLCPFCYTHPPFPGMRRGSACMQCTHPRCPQALAQLAVAACEECEDGSLVLDPSSGPKWKMFCNMAACNVLIHLCEDAFKLTVSEIPCESCDAMTLKVEFHKAKTPLEDGETHHVGCMFCDPVLQPLVRFQHAVSKHPMHRRHHGGGRGRGRRRPHRPKPKDKMSELDRYFV